MPRHALPRARRARHVLRACAPPSGHRRTPPAHRRLRSGLSTPFHGLLGAGTAGRRLCAAGLRDRKSVGGRRRGPRGGPRGRSQSDLPRTKHRRGQRCVAGIAAALHGVGRRPRPLFREHGRRRGVRRRRGPLCRPARRGLERLGLRLGGAPLRSGRRRPVAGRRAASRPGRSDCRGFLRHRRSGRDRGGRARALPDGASGHPRARRRCRPRPASRPAARQ